MNQVERAGWQEWKRERRSARPPSIADVLPVTVDVAAIRAGLGGSRPMTQAEFGRRFGFSLAAVRDWEQGRRRPDASARALLLVIAHSPAAVETALWSAVAAPIRVAQLRPDVPVLSRADALRQHAAAVMREGDQMPA